jgi:hypothetical protein
MLERMGVAAERRALERFSVVQHADAYDQLYWRIATEARLSDRGTVSR